jgi:hypothetical protein
MRIAVLEVEDEDSAGYVPDSSMTHSQLFRAPATLGILLLSISSLPTGAQAPAGLAASALVNPAFAWIPRSAPGFRVYFLADSYPALHQDSLLSRLPLAARHAERLLGVPPLSKPIDLFFVDSREQMTALVGGRATGFAQPSARAVFLMTHPAWRAFERHEIMHVVAEQAWGRPGPNTDWLQEGLAQAADGRCGNYSNAGVLLALVERRGWIPYPDVLARFRAQPDLRAYLQSAVFVDYLLQQFGPAPLERLWRQGAALDGSIAGRKLRLVEREWRATLAESERPSPAELDGIESKGCG